MSLRILIAGCGYVGSVLAGRLAAEGHRVWGLRRSASALPAGVVALRADLGDPASLGGLPGSLDFVFYTAASDRRDDEAYRRIYVEGIRNLLGSLNRFERRPRRVFYTSSTAVYAQRGGAWVDESSPTEPTEFGGIRLLQGERSVLEDEIPGTVVRLAGIYGPGRARLIERALREPPPATDDPPSYTNRIHRDDAAGALAHLMLCDRPGDLYVGVDDEPVALDEVLSWIRARLGLSPESTAGRSVGAIDRREGGKRCSNARLSKTGYRFLFPTFREGYGAMIDPARE